MSNIDREDTNELRGNNIIKQVLISIALMVPTTALSLWFSPNSTPFPIATFRLSIGFIISISLWFGIVGIASGFLSVFVVYILYRSVAEAIIISLDVMIRGVIIFSFFRKMKLQPSIDDAKSMVGILLFGVIIGNIVGVLISDFLLCNLLSIDCIAYVNVIVNQTIIDGIIIATIAVPSLKKGTKIIERMLGESSVKNKTIL